MANITRLLEIIILHVMVSYKSAKPLNTWAGSHDGMIMASRDSSHSLQPGMSDVNLNSGKESSVASVKTRPHRMLTSYHGSRIGSHLASRAKSRTKQTPSPSPKELSQHKHRHKHKLKAWSLENEILLSKDDVTAWPQDESADSVQNAQRVVMRHDPKNKTTASNSRHSDQAAYYVDKSHLIHQPKITAIHRYNPFPDASNISILTNHGLTLTKSAEPITPQISRDNEGSSPTVPYVTSHAMAPSGAVHIKYKSGNGPNLPLLSHFHIPNFGMVDANSYPRRPPIKGTHSIEGTFLWAVGLFGSVENGAIFLTAVFSKNFRKPLHMLVGTIAGTDLFVCLIYIPTYTYFLLEGNRNLADQSLLPSDSYETIFTDESPFSFCNISRAIFVEVASVTLTVKALIALYLYILTCSRSWAKTLFSPRNTGFFIFLALLLNFVVLFLPSFVGYDKVDFYPNAFVCGPPAKSPRTIGNWSLENISAVYSTMTLSLHLLELSVICFCFIHVHRAILKGKVYSDRYRDKDSLAKINYTRALKIMVLVFTSFLICWLPVYVVNVIDPDHTKLPSDVHHLVMDLLLLKSSINPTIYVYGMRSLRYEMKLLCMCKCRAEDRHKYIQKPQVTSSLDAATRSADTACEAAE